ncbi:MAG: hypothetical protein M3Y80_07020, partial [Verrucomicrobiota bacterium]|nr:hypothetical protein [Verrucomicrobiota bacterium]
PRKIEIFEPFGAAFELTKRILFQPFDVSKWLVIGFAAFLSHFAGGGGGGFNYNSKFRNANWSFHSTTHDAVASAAGMPAWALPLIGLGAILLILLVLVFMWLGARGKFIFTDCIVRNRGAIVEPWHEYRHEANSYFLFSLCAAAILLCALSVASVPLWFPLLTRGDVPEGIGLLLGLSVLGLVMLIAGVSLSLLLSFMIPLMYRRRCGAVEAARAALGLVTAHPVPVILYLLFTIVLWLAFAIVSCLTTCLTCCLTAIPYVGTVIMLPVYVLFRSYLLLFVRQFGADYDVWGAVTAIETAAPPAEAPPLPPSAPPPIDPPPMTT